MRHLRAHHAAASRSASASPGEIALGEIAHSLQMSFVPAKGNVRTRELYAHIESLCPVSLFVLSLSHSRPVLHGPAPTKQPRGHCHRPRAAWSGPGMHVHGRRRPLSCGQERSSPYFVCADCCRSSLAHLRGRDRVRESCCCASRRPPRPQQRRASTRSSAATRTRRTQISARASLPPRCESSPCAARCAAAAAASVLARRGTGWLTLAGPGASAGTRSRYTLPTKASLAERAMAPATVSVDASATYHSGPRRWANGGSRGARVSMSSR